jgi:hypothetical protein
VQRCSADKSGAMCGDYDDEMMMVKPLPRSVRDVITNVPSCEISMQT